MNLIDRLDRIARLDQLIRMKNTGTPEALAMRLGVSKRTVFEILNDMRQLGAQIDYCPDRRSYYYSNDGRFKFGFILQHDRMQKIVGGCSIAPPVNAAFQSPFLCYLSHFTSSWTRWTAAPAASE